VFLRFDCEVFCLKPNFELFLFPKLRLILKHWPQFAPPVGEKDSKGAKQREERQRERQRGRQRGRERRERRVTGVAY